MKNKKYIISLFIVIALVQLYVPAKMIFDSENVLKSGVSFKFKVAPVDPNDPFRGKYVALRYADNFTEVLNENDWKAQEAIYVVLATDNEGFAMIQSVSKDRPTDTENYIAAVVDQVSNDKSNKLHIAYPFDRFYMDERKANDAEVAYNESMRVTATQITYALVYVKNGNAVLDDILIDGVSILDIVEKRNNY